ncbi:hypothetical protein GH733_019091, partial [Mirounga leonina]
KVGGKRQTPPIAQNPARITDKAAPLRHKGGAFVGTALVGFSADEAHNIVKECIDGVLGGEDYNQNNINQWTASIVEQSLTHLVKLGKAYKYIVTCAVVQRSAYGFHTASSCFWDTTSDGTCTVRWENRTMNCIVNVFAIAIVL